MKENDNHTADQYHDHMRRIHAIITDWKLGTIGLHEKRRRIVEENQVYYGGAFRSPATGEWLTSMPRQRNEIADVVAEMTGAPLEAVTAALAARRKAYCAANDAETATEARQLMIAGTESYGEILKAAGAAATPPEGWRP